ncbi:protein kinase domain-containing protein [Pedococcus soli]
MEPPFTEAQAVAAFQEYGVVTPRLGLGAFKVAYRGRRDEADLVVKIIKEPVIGADDDLADIPERFARELLAMESVDCPHVVTLSERPSIRDVGLNQHLWYVEPFYPGPTLQEAIAAGQAGPQLSQKVLLHMLRAVKAMWESPSRIVHRDIKPGNIIQNGDDLVLLDLGIAFHSDLSAITESFMTSPKTARYAAPEQFLARRYATIDFRTDLYQIGIVAFEAATGKHPFWQTGIRPDEYRRRMASFSAIELDGYALPPHVVNMIVRLLAERPAGRYRSVDKPLQILEEDS